MNPNNTSTVYSTSLLHQHCLFFHFVRSPHSPVCSPNLTCEGWLTLWACTPKLSSCCLFTNLTQRSPSAARYGTTPLYLNTTSYTLRFFSLAVFITLTFSLLYCFSAFLQDAGPSIRILVVQMDIEDSHCSDELIASAKYFFVSDFV